MKIFQIKKLFVFSFLSCFLIGSCSASQSTKDIESAIEAATLARKEHTKPYNINLPISEYSNRLIDIQNALNSAWAKHSKDVQFGKYLLDLWNNEEPGVPDESWKEINHPVIKTEIALLLGQARRHCLINTDISELRSYVLENLESSNKLAKSVAVDALGIVGNSEDIPLLAKMVLEEKEGWAESAAGSLRSMRSKEALVKLEELSKSVKRKSLKEFVGNILSDYGEGFMGFLPPACSV